MPRVPILKKKLNLDQGDQLNILQSITKIQVMSNNKTIIKIQKEQKFKNI